MDIVIEGSDELSDLYLECNQNKSFLYRCLGEQNHLETHPMQTAGYMYIKA